MEGQLPVRGKQNGRLSIRTFRQKCSLVRVPLMGHRILNFFLKRKKPLRQCSKMTYLKFLGNNLLKSYSDLKIIFAAVTKWPVVEHSNDQGPGLGSS